MSSEVIDYGKLVDEAMHVIVYKVLKLVQQNGLPGAHHFFISFITKHPGVVLSQVLKNKYPKEMTIVLQYQYQDLAVDSKGFTVTLSFNGVKEKIYIPFASITTFADPSVQFGLQFREVENLDEHDISVELEDHPGGDDKPPTKPKGKKSDKKPENNVVAFDKFKNKKK